MAFLPVLCVELMKPFCKGNFGEESDTLASLDYYGSLIV
jgi:hypothetical protein